MNNKDPLTPEEVQAASERFFPLFDIILRNMPEGSKTEDCLSVMASVCELAHKMRDEEEEKNKPLPFGFNKKKDDDTSSTEE
jgi:L-serine deaminase|tara:strand:+ start:1100 stop:1345 length:246 start_codon:yes stop_codon:yes gene_type:complete